MEGRFADAVIVAAGGSTRMGGIDKLSEPLLDKPLLAWSIDAMASAESVNHVVVVTRPDRVDDLAAQAWIGSASVVAGGPQRSDSVRAGVEAATADVVLVHDGARPLASSNLADAVARAAAAHGAAVPAIPVADSLKRASGGSIESSVDRDGLVRTQTPQGARRDLLLAAFDRAAGASYTDEAALLEAAGSAVVTVPGEAANIKVTDPSDMELVRALANARHGAAIDQRLGWGEDSHPFGPDMGLLLGGVEIAAAPRLHGHSDGDVVLHALATAILSAAHVGDLGRLFPANDARTRGIASSHLVAEAVLQALRQGWTVEGAQVSIVGARPKIGGRRLDEMASRIAELVGSKPGSVSVVASTGNLSGDAGAGRVITATALVTVVRR
jgi:2-C-methyl-D-erythritol 4-phosphate cytidylyltransferase/2-C-methyl-D-erythritol 2,4-cyclodiphosphate synthase